MKDVFFGNVNTSWKCRFELPVKACHGFTASVGEDVEPVLSEEHDGYKWITIEDALSMKEPLSHHAKFLFGQLKGSE